MMTFWTTYAYPFILALFGVLVGVYLGNRQTIKRLSYHVQVKRDVYITDEDSLIADNVEERHQVNILIWNSGKAFIPYQDVAEQDPVTIRLSESVQQDQEFGLKVVESGNHIYARALQLGGGLIRPKWDFLNAGDGFEIRAHVIGNIRSAHVDISGTIRGISRGLHRRETSPSVPDGFFLVVFVVLLIAMTGHYFAGSFDGEMDVLRELFSVLFREGNWRIGLWDSIKAGVGLLIYAVMLPLYMFAGWEISRNKARIPLFVFQRANMFEPRTTYPGR